MSTDTLADVLADASVGSDSLPLPNDESSKANLPFLTLIFLRLSVGSKNNVIRKDENMKAKQPPF